MERDPLAVDPEVMRELGYRTVDMLVDWLHADEPLLRLTSREEMERRLSAPPPAAGESFDEILDRLGRDVLPFATRLAHPRYFGFIPGSGTWPGALADFIVSAGNIDTSWWMGTAGPTQLELTVVDWFKSWLGYPLDAGGLLLSGGSAANMTAMACAREALLGAMSDRVVIYLADQAHSSLARAARILGFRPEQVRVLPVDQQYRMRPVALAAAMDADVRSGRQPLFVAAVAGSTNTGAIDPLPEISAICRERGAWLHVDAAYGGFAALTERGKGWLAGIELADSITLDPHKWFYQPIECGCLLVRSGYLLRDAFTIVPDYLKDIETADQEVNFSDLGMQLTRTCRALKVWMSVSYFGTDAFRAAIDRSLDLARLAQARIEASETLELLNPATLGVVCFRRRFPGVADEDDLTRRNGALIEALTETGDGLVSSTRLHGRFAIRLCVLNHTSSWADVERVLSWLEQAQAPDKPDPDVPPLSRDRHPTVEEHMWLSRERAPVARLRAIPLFADLSDEELARVREAAWEATMATGDVIVRQWEPSREFYVILEGTAEARTTDRVLNDLHPGEFFGELAALDWGAGFGYPRLASVVATSAMRLLVLPNGRFTSLMRQVPPFAEQVQRVVRERLPRV